MDTFLYNQIATVESLITQANATLLVITAGGVASFSFDDGQTRETVTKTDIDKLENFITKLYNRRDFLRARTGDDNGGDSIAVASW